MATAGVTANSLPSLLLSLHKLKASALTAIILGQLKPRMLRHLHRLVAKRSDKFVRGIREGILRRPALNLLPNDGRTAQVLAAPCLDYSLCRLPGLLRGRRPLDRGGRSPSARMEDHDGYYVSLVHHSLVV